MQYNVAQLLKEDIGFTRVHRVDGSFPLFNEVVSQGRARGRLVLMRTDKGVWASALLEARAPSTCSRCLTAFDQLVTLTIEEEFFPSVDLNTGQAVTALDKPEGAFGLDEQHVLDLSEAVRQYYIANFPIKPLCGHGCVGLCPHCGQDLNKGVCSCDTAVVDPRWAPLKRLLEGGR